MMFTDRIDESGFWHRRSWAVAGLMVVFVGVASCAGNGPRTVTFTADGNTCTHDAGSEIYRRPTIVLVNNMDRKVGLAVWPVPAGTTANETCHPATIRRVNLKG